MTAPVHNFRPALAESLIIAARHLIASNEAREQYAAAHGYEGEAYQALDERYFADRRNYHDLLGQVDLDVDKLRRAM